MKLGILVSHPIQYLVPFFRVLAATPGIDLVVFYTWDFGIKKTMDPEFRREIKWDIPLLEGYRSIFLKNYSPKPSSGFWGQINPGIINSLRKEKCDALLLYGWNSFTNWIALLASRAFNVRIFLRGESPWNQERAKPTWKRFIKKVLLKPLFLSTEAFLYIGKENKEFYLQYGVPESKLVRVPYAVDNARLFKSVQELIPCKAELRKSLLGVQDDRGIVLFSGKLIPKKRPMDLLRAFQEVQKRFRAKRMNTDLVFVGDGILREELEKYVRENGISGVHFVGFKNQTELPGYYAAADLFVLPSGEGETWGLVVNEAMCFGLPVIVSDAVGCGKDLVYEGANGFQFPLGDINALSDRLEKIISNTDLKINYGIKSREIIKEYSFERGAERFREVLTK